MSNPTCEQTVEALFDERVRLVTDAVALVQRVDNELQAKLTRLRDEIAAVKALAYQLDATFDPGGTLPDDCGEWVEQHTAVIDKLKAALA